MKKLTLALLSLMLFLGMGTAFAQDAPATLPDMTYTPISGSTVAPGDRITFDVPEAYQESMIYLLYTTDFAAFSNADTYEGKMAIMAEVQDEDYAGPIMTAGYMGEWMMPCQIPDDAQPGQLVMLAFWMAMGGDVSEVSDVMTLTYTVAGEAAKVNPPVFTPGEGAIAQGGEVELSCDASGAHYICYVLNDPEFDEYLDWEDDTDVKTKYVYNTSDAGHTHIFINEETTIKAWVVTLDHMDAITGISEAVVATYTPVALPAAPTFEPAAGEVAFGTFVELNCATQGAAIHFTTDGTEPTAESEEYSWFSEILITKAMTVKAIAIKDDYRSAVVEAAYTVAPVKAALSIASPMLDDNTVGKNVAVGLTINDPENPASQQWINTNPSVVYYTTDGTTEPSKAAYEAQTDKENGVIKMVATQMDEYGYVQTDMEGNAMVLTFSEDTHLKAIGYMTMGEMEIVTPVLDKELKVKSFDNPTFSLATYTKVAAGDKLVIKNPASRPEEDEDGEFDDVEPVNAAEATLYFSFDGTKPTSGAYNAQEEDWSLDKPYSTYKVFKAEGTDVEITFGQDEQGYYAYVPAITDLFYMPGYDTIRLGADGLFNVDVWCMGAEEVGTHPMTGRPLYFNSGSDFVNAVYTMKDDLPVAAPVFSVAAGEVEKGTKMELACETEGAAIYYTVDGAEPTAESTLYAEAIEINEDMTVKAIAIKGDFKSEVATAAYTVVEPVVETVATPTFSVKAGEVAEGTKVSIACETEGAVIYYTVDGAEPTAESTEYKEAITIDKAMTVKAIAVKGEAKSEVAVAAYTVKTANEDEELAGVSVYPNPSNGLFNIELPVAATIEVFASNGVLTQRISANAGVATLNIDRSGIYFIRIAGEGRAAIKRVIVR